MTRLLSAALCLVMAVLVAVLTQRESDARAVDHARHDALLAAPRIVRDVLSYDYRTMDADIAQARRDTTGAFAQQYDAYATDLESKAVANRAIVQAQPQAPGIVSASAHRVVILVFVDQVSVRQPQASAQPTTSAAQSRVQLTLQKVGSRWLLVALSAV